MCKVTKKNHTCKYFKPIYLFLRILGAKKGMEHKKRGCVISPDNGSKVGLKAQKLLAQGIALGIVAVSKAPCKGKSLINCLVSASFCPYYYICTWKNKEVKIFISANFC